MVLFFLMSYCFESLKDGLKEGRLCGFLKLIEHFIILYITLHFYT